MSTSESRNGLIIRPIRREEIPRLVEIIRNSFLTVAEELKLSPETSPRFTGFSISEERLYYQFDVEKRVMLCGEIRGETAGYYSLSNPKDGECEINNLSVLPEFRHRGIGRAFVFDGIERAKHAGCGSVTVSIVDTNLRLRRWYEGIGFRYERTEIFPGFDFTCGEMRMGLGR